MVYQYNLQMIIAVGFKVGNGKMVQVKIIAKCIDLWVQFWYHNFEIILCLKCNKIGNNKYRNFECEVWKALKFFTICAIRLILEYKI